MEDRQINFFKSKDLNSVLKPLKEGTIVNIDKLEVMVLGGTWGSYPVDYRYEFIRDLYYAANIKNIEPIAACIGSIIGLSKPLLCIAY